MKYLTTAYGDAVVVCPVCYVNVLDVHRAAHAATHEAPKKKPVETGAGADTTGQQKPAPRKRAPKKETRA